MTYILYLQVPLKKLKPPFIPRCTNLAVDCNFDPIFTSEPISLTPDDMYFVYINRLSENESTSDDYENFDMVNENFLTHNF